MQIMCMCITRSRRSITEDEGWVMETAIRPDEGSNSPRVCGLLRIPPPISSAQKGRVEGLGRERRGEHRRWTVLRSIIDDPTCICGARHVLKPVPRSVPRIVCARIGSGYPHDSIPASSSSSSTSRLFRAAVCGLEAATSARRGCGPDRIRVYLRHILGVRHVAVGR